MWTVWKRSSRQRSVWDSFKYQLRLGGRMNRKSWWMQNRHGGLLFTEFVCHYSSLGLSKYSWRLATKGMSKIFPLLFWFLFFFLKTRSNMGWDSDIQDIQTIPPFLVRIRRKKERVEIVHPAGAWTGSMRSGDQKPFSLSSAPMTSVSNASVNCKWQ